MIDELSRDVGLSNKSDEFLTSQQVCDQLQIHLNTFYRMVQSGQLQAYSITVTRGGKRCYRVKRTDLDYYLSQRYCGS